MITAMLTLALASGQPPARPMLERGQAQAMLDIPDEIGPAIVPYVQCKMASAGIEMRDPDSGAVLPPMAGAAADCGQVRTQASAAADRMLRDQGHTSEVERRALIMRTLDSVDDLVGSIPTITAPAPTPR